MSLRLRLASVWMPRSMMADEIVRIRSATDAALDALLAEHAPNFHIDTGMDIGRGLEAMRASMGNGHEQRVRALIDAVGTERAITLGREALFRTGLALGKDARERLEVKDTKEDLIRAVGIVYRILGIDITVVQTPEGERMEVTRCPFSGHYSKETCVILSAVDEGTVRGLCPSAGMRFEKRITDGSKRCLASIDFTVVR